MLTVGGILGTVTFWEGITIGASAGLISGLILGVLSLLKNVVQRWYGVYLRVRRHS